MEPHPQSGRATRVGTWWGNALNEHRRDGSRQSEEIDVIGLRRSSVAVVGECKWQNSQLGLSVLKELETYKIPALRQARARLACDLRIVLFSKSGFGSRLQEVAQQRDDLELVGSDQIVADLVAS